LIKILTNTYKEFPELNFRAILAYTNRYQTISANLNNCNRKFNSQLATNKLRAIARFKEYRQAGIEGCKMIKN
jgi:hypothetical protein